ncbi:MAG TPA: hypothetical protein VMM60_12970 [Ilumatobacter sp.]|nr:hypothetical protein [Ilumatobacter sp.]
MSERSPFPFHGPIDPADVTGRDEIIADLVERVTARRPTVLVAPRRFGKTTVLGAVAARLAHTTTVIQIDLYALRSWSDFAGRLSDALIAVPAGRRHLIERLAASIELNLGVVKAAVARPDRPEADLTVDRLLDVVVRHAVATETLVIFDEFSSIANVDGAAGLLRTKLQHHYQRVGLLFAGSEPSTMRLLFTDAEQPFFAQADLVDLAPLSLSHVHDMIESAFSAENRSVPAGLAAKIHAFSNGHPQRTMQLADAAWHASRDEVDDQLVFVEALQRCRAATAAGFETRFIDFSSSEQAVLRLLAHNHGLYGRDAELLNLSSSSAAGAITRLVRNGAVDAPPADPRIIDPLLADWVARRFA